MTSRSRERLSAMATTPTTRSKRCLDGRSVDLHFVTDQTASGVLGLSVWDVGEVPRNPCHWLGRLFDPGPRGRSRHSARGPGRCATPRLRPMRQLDGYEGKFPNGPCQKTWWSRGMPTSQGCDVLPGERPSRLRELVRPRRRRALPAGPGQVDKLWILDVNGQRLVVDATYSPATTIAERLALIQIAQSIRFVANAA